MKITINFFMCTILLLGMYGCNDDSSKDCSCDENSKSVSVNEQAGKIIFDVESSLWGIEVIPSNTIDSKQIFLACDMDKQFRKEGLSVTFSGMAYLLPSNSPIAGIERYCLTIKDVKL